MSNVESANIEHFKVYMKDRFSYAGLYCYYIMQFAWYILDARILAHFTFSPVFLAVANLQKKIKEQEWK